MDSMNKTHFRLSKSKQRSLYKLGMVVGLIIVVSDVFVDSEDSVLALGAESTAGLALALGMCVLLINLYERNGSI
jgi:hypothetical protein